MSSRWTGRPGPKDLIFTARLIEAPEALSLGLLNEGVPDLPTLQRRADETARLVAGKAPITMEAAKEAVLRLLRTLSREEGRDLILRAYMSEDFREVMDAFLNKRTPNWKRPIGSAAIRRALPARVFEAICLRSIADAIFVIRSIPSGNSAWEPRRAVASG